MIDLNDTCDRNKGLKKRKILCVSCKLYFVCYLINFFVTKITYAVNFFARLLLFFYRLKANLIVWRNIPYVIWWTDSVWKGIRVYMLKLLHWWRMTKCFCEKLCLELWTDGRISGFVENWELCFCRYCALNVLATLALLSMYKENWWFLSVCIIESNLKRISCSECSYKIIKSFFYFTIEIQMNFFALQKKSLNFQRTKTCSWRMHVKHWGSIKKKNVLYCRVFD